jgi:hypothetical protein
LLGGAREHIRVGVVAIEAAARRRDGTIGIVVARRERTAACVAAVRRARVAVLAFLGNGAPCGSGPGSPASIGRRASPAFASRPDPACTCPASTRAGGALAVCSRAGRGRIEVEPCASACSQAEQQCSEAVPSEVRKSKRHGAAVEPISFETQGAHGTSW